METASLYQQYLIARQQHPGKYARDLAALLNISEAELVHARVGHDARRLASDPRALLTDLQHVGELKAITRNTYAVHEHLGAYHHQHLDGHAGLILNPRDIDLRLFLNQWRSAFTLSEETARGIRHSIQFFDAQGDAVHKVYVTGNSNHDAWNALIARHLTADNPPLAIAPEAVTAPVTAINAAQLDSQWRAMTDVHQFFRLLQQHQITRQQAFAAVGDDLAWRVDNSALRQLLHQAVNDQNEIMVFVGNRGCVQIFTGVLERVALHNEWINIFNRRFTLHLIESAIHESWVTRKPTKDGFVTSLELFAADGIQIAQLFGQRTEGDAEQAQWRKQIAQLTQLKGAAA